MSDLRINRERPERSRALLLYMIAAAGLPLSSVLSSLLLPAISELSLYEKLLISDALYYIPFMIVPFLIYIRKNAEVYSSCRSDGFSVGRLFLIVPLALCTFSLCNNITVLWALPLQKIGLDIYAGGIPAPTNVRELILAVISSAAIPAVCEELLFRSILLSSIEKYGTRRAVLTTSLMFALLHGSPVGLPGEFIAGMIIAAVAVSCNSVYAGMVMHTLYNTIIVLIEYLQQNVSTGGDIMQQLGGISGVFSTLLNILLFGTVTAFLLGSMFARAHLNGIKPVPNSKPDRLSRCEILFLSVSGAAVLLLYTLSTLAML